MLERLALDIKDYAEDHARQGHSRTVNQLAGLQPNDLRECVKEAKAGRRARGLMLNLSGNRLGTATAKVEQLLKHLQELRDDTQSACI